MGEQAILARVRTWIRVRNGLRAGGGAVVVLLAATLGGRVVGAPVPAVVLGAVPASVVAGAIWPVAGERRLLRAGRRLGVGERLAALDLVVRRGLAALVTPLAAEIVAARPRGWRLVAGPLECAILCAALGLGMVVLFTPLPGGASAPTGPELTEDALVGTVLPPAPTAATASPQPAEALSLYPSAAEIPAYSPYQDLLAAVLGLEEPELGGLSGDEVAARLAAEEGLLRQLAERIAAAAAGGMSPAERAELAPLAREVARPDLRERLETLLGQEGEGPAREAARAVEAVLEAVERATDRGDAGSGTASDASPQPTPGPGTTTTGPGDLEPGFGELTNPSDVEGHDPVMAGEDDFPFPGLARGVPLEPGPLGDWRPAPGEEDPDVVRGGEGPLRAYIVPGIPGEPPPRSLPDSGALSPQEVEVVLRTRGLPGDLRDLVRRYFELIGGNP
ncbi:MAG: hypothetical protein BIP78_0890 [Candidatus Bipolaricaulis sibiricus]|uniref:Uncharacterized protein n=1 Tax=Bipolaricaulis sibiricus TaxID=2501609 RepID=A0A410FUC0_BIPS1|nr:MAG: hypothetical protein BIP78_0890 [Candidatus Bipolaricaulis sibiricus]